MVIPADFLIEYHLSVFDVSNIFSHTCSHESVLEPAVWSFDLALILILQPVFDVAVVVRLERNVFILDQLLFYGQFFQNILLSTLC